MRSFNDPFEGRVNFVLEATEEETLAHVAEIIKRRQQVSHEEAIAKAGHISLIATPGRLRHIS